MSIRRILPVVTRPAARVAVAVALLGLLPAVSSAQTIAGGDAADRWTPWAGCWTPLEAQTSGRSLRVCVVPAADHSGARLVTFSGDQQLNEETVRPDGTASSTTERGCRSERRTRWASAGLRLFSNGEVTCDGQAAQSFSAISTLLSRNRWLDVQVTGPAGREVVRMAQYTRSTEAPPAAIADALRAQPGSLPTLTPRTSIDDVIEASQAVASPAVEVWIAETEPRLALNRRSLQTLSAAKVSEPVIDLLVGLAYPKQFEIRRQSPGGGFSAAGPFGFGGAFDPMFGPGFGPWGLGWDPLGMYASIYSPFGLGLYSGSFFPYAYGPYAFGPYPYGGSFYGGILNGSVLPGSGGGGSGEPVASGTGLAVNGRGYTRVQPRESVAERSASDRGGDASSTYSAGGAGSGGGGGGSVSPGGYSSGDGGGASSGGASGGNFAVPR